MCFEPSCRRLQKGENGTLEWNYDLSPADVRSGDVCVCRNNSALTTDGEWNPGNGAPIWDSCGLQGSLLALVRNYWTYMYFAVMILEVVLFSSAVFFVEWPDPPRVEFHDDAFKERRLADIRKHKVCLLIAHYGNFGALEASLEPALEIFPPDHIYICHNSNHQYPFNKGRIADTTKKIRALEAKLKIPEGVHVNYAYSCEGNKTLGIYQTALHKCGHMKYCMMIDNDVILPEDLHIPMDIFEDKNMSHVKARTGASHEHEPREGMRWRLPWSPDPLASPMEP